MRHALTRCALLVGAALGACAPPPTDADDFNAEQDAGDAAVEATVDAPRDAVTDAPRDAVTDAPRDATVDAPDVAPDAAPDAGARVYERVYLYRMAAAAFPAQAGPSVAVHVPPGFDPTPPLGVQVYFHGWSNCVANVVGATNTPCTAGGPARRASDLITQFDAARVNALLVVPELRVDAMTGDPGAFARAGAFRAFLQELLTTQLAPVIGRRDVADVGRVSVMAHSGGYVAAAAVARVGEVAALRELALLDALYGEVSTFDRWVQGGLARFVPPAATGLRFVDVYTTSGGTRANSRAMAGRAVAWLSGAGRLGSLLDDDTVTMLEPEAYAHPVIFKHSALSHDNTTRYYPRRLFAASGFAPLP
jgi:hypothetical protein